MAECRECKENGKPKYEFSLSDFSTKSLKIHLFSTIHAGSEYVKNFEQLEKTKKDAKETAEKKQPTIEHLIGTNLTSSGILSVADKRIINMITCNNLSFGLLSDPAFKALCKYELKDESNYRKRVLTEAYKLVRAKILKDLDDCANLSFTIDCWAGPQFHLRSLLGSAKRSLQFLCSLVRHQMGLFILYEFGVSTGIPNGVPKGLPSADQINYRTFRALSCIIIVNIGGYLFSAFYAMLIRPSISSPITAWFSQASTGIPLLIGAASNGPILYFTSSEYRQAFQTEFQKVLHRSVSQNQVVPLPNIPH
ncbi:hypothetical protein niasHT_038529 [Heterodera trifolii]|uniref:Uncharacterized protein n=1 Tax=Heterodera trifolii TaxID=157864 RepID=A0ABD2I7G9_9BILA